MLQDPRAVRGDSQGLNLAGELTGSYADINGASHGYLRYADCTFVEFNAPGSGTNYGNGTVGSSVNLWGTVAGYASDPNGFGFAFVRFGNRKMDSFEAPLPGNQGTAALAINLWGQLTGWFYDANGMAHGFVAVATQ